MELAASVRTGDYTTLTVAHGIREIIVTAQSDQLGSITVTGTGWTVVPSDTAITARYTVPQGAYQDLQDALDALVFLCSAADYADGTVSVSAVMRSGATAQIGSVTIHWSAIINWDAFEAYAYTWQAVEDAQMTWADLEGLPIPTGGDAG